MTMPSMVTDVSDERRHPDVALDVVDGRQRVVVAVDGAHTARVAERRVGAQAREVDLERLVSARSVVSPLTSTVTVVVRLPTVMVPRVDMSWT